jgi:hypothetical protein
LRTVGILSVIILAATVGTHPKLAQADAFKMAFMPSITFTLAATAGTGSATTSD